MKKGHWVGRVSNLWEGAITTIARPLKLTTGFFTWRNCVKNVKNKLTYWSFLYRSWCILWFFIVQAQIWNFAIEFLLFLSSMYIPFVTWKAKSPAIEQQNCSGSKKHDQLLLSKKEFILYTFQRRMLIEPPSYKPPYLEVEFRSKLGYNYITTVTVSFCCIAKALYFGLQESSFWPWADLGGGGHRTLLLHRDSTSRRPKGPPFGTF